MNWQISNCKRKSDLFGYENQGLNYDIYRPDYSQEMINNILCCPKYENYLDLASGTGQVYFKIQSKFNGFRIGQDISEKQYQVLSTKIKNLNNNKCISILGDSLKITQQLDQININTKFDLITIGQALHWFDFDVLMNYILSDLLVPNGSIGVLSYIAEEVYLDVDELERLENRVIENKLELKNSLSLYQTQFYDEVKQYFDCDRDNLGSGYLKYNFKKYFSQVDFKEYHEYTPQTLEQVIKYLKTYSAYNVYLQKFPERIDPIITFTDALMDKYRQIVKVNNFKTEYPPLVLYNKFFTHLLRK